MIRDTIHFIHSFKFLNSFFIIFYISIIQNTANANDFFTVDNISIDIVSEDSTSARNNATDQAILIGLERLLSWKLNNNDYILITSILNNVNDKPDIKDFVVGYKLHYEKLSDVNYQAEFSIFFNLQKIKSWINIHNIYFYEKLTSKIINLNANFSSFLNWRVLISNINNIKEIVDYKIITLSHNNALIQININIENEASLFSIFNKSRIDIQKTFNTNYEYNINLIDNTKRVVESYEERDKNDKNKDASILLTE